MFQATLRRGLQVRLPGCLLSMAVVVALTGCGGNNPGTWPVDKVAAQVAESLELTNVTLSPTERGLEGSGVRSDGETLTLLVTQHPEQSEIRWDARGDRGFVEEGRFQLR